MTPYEIALSLNGAAKRRDEAMKMSAWAQANLMSMWAGKSETIQPTRLYRSPFDPPEFTDKETFDRHMRSRIAAEKAESEDPYV